jgi:UDP-N-acetylmuramoyl-tripeptide--D-alanyl-D-alanine ligase
MIAWCLSEVAQCARGELVGGDAAFNGVSIDTRTLKPGALFVALSGENFDGHDFVTEAAERGAVAALVSRTLPVTIPQVVVSDALAALSAFARGVSSRFRSLV